MTRVFIALGLAALSFALLANVTRGHADPERDGRARVHDQADPERQGRDELKAGSYKLVVNDKADIHDFVLEGPGVEREVTSVPFKGTKTVTLKLRTGGKYKFYCRPHEPVMFGFVTVK